jgi:hypothetical protein
MDELFPGFIGHLHSKGVTGCHVAQDATYFLPGVGALPHKVGIAPDVLMQLATRHLIEGILRDDYINQNPAVSLNLGSQAKGLVIDGGKVHGVHLANGTTLQAELVVDCMGKSSPIADWLAAHGYSKPKTSTLSADVSYVSRQALLLHIIVRFTYPSHAPL